MKSNMSQTPLTDAQLDAALRSDRDQILPSSGFADSVLAAVSAEAGAPAPIPFPWKRALPGLIGASAAALALAVTLIAALVRAHAAARALSARGFSLPAGRGFDLAPLLRGAAHADALWILFALAIPLLCLLLMRRLLRHG
jgi:hypothetical protein